MRQIIIGSVVVAMAFTLRHTWMIWTQVIAGLALIVLGNFILSRKDK